MRRRKLLAALAAVLAVAVAVGAVAGWPQQDRVTAANFDRIHEGMARADVLAVLGPSGDYASMPVGLGGRFGGWPYSISGDANRHDDCAFVEWVGDTGDICILFDAKNRVGQCHFEPLSRIELSPLDTFRWRVERQWDKWFPER